MKTKKNKITNSNKIFKKAIKIIPTGSQSFSKGHTQFVDGVAPKYLDKGIGSKVWDVDGNKYIDYIMGCHFDTWMLTKILTIQLLSNLKRFNFQ